MFSWPSLAYVCTNVASNPIHSFRIVAILLNIEARFNTIRQCPAWIWSQRNRMFLPLLNVNIQYFAEPTAWISNPVSEGLRHLIHLSHSHVLVIFPAQVSPLHVSAIFPAQVSPLHVSAILPLRFPHYMFQPSLPHRFLHYMFQPSSRSGFPITCFSHLSRSGFPITCFSYLPAQVSPLHGECVTDTDCWNTSRSAYFTFCAVRPWHPRVVVHASCYLKPGTHETLAKCWRNVGPASWTVVLH